MVSRQEAVARFEHAMRGLRGPGLKPELVLQRTLERTGLLREPHPDEVQFVHRTFRDYLAAKEVVDACDIELLVEHSHLDSWYDVTSKPYEPTPALCPTWTSASTASRCGHPRARADAARPAG